MDNKCYRKTCGDLHTAYIEAAQESMLSAGLEAKPLNTEVPYYENNINIKDIRASFDGTWQRRGFSSLNGVVSCISNGKVIDYEVLTKVCRFCQYWKKFKSSEEFEEWKIHHNCDINHIGSAGAMESAGVISIFNRSKESRCLRYMRYLGDGDTKSFKDVVNANVYPEKEPIKEECIGHVQKKVGARLRSLKLKYKGVNLEDGK